MDLELCIKAILKHMDSEGTLELVIENCRVRAFAYDSESSIAGTVQLANNKTFDRWANSGSVDLHMGVLGLEQSTQKVLAQAIEIYK